MARIAQHAGNVASSSVLSGFEGDAETTGKRVGFQSASVLRDPSPTEDGSLGFVSFNYNGTGGLPAMVAFLQAIKPPKGNLASVPVVVDPLVLTGEGFQATVRVPFMTGKADARDPAPAIPKLSQLLNKRWQRAIQVPLPQLRDPLL